MCGSLEYRLPILILDDPKRRKSLGLVDCPFCGLGKTMLTPMFWESDYTLVSSGLSFYLPLPYGIYASVDFAKPLRELKVAGTPMDGTRSNDYRIHGNIGWKF